LHTKITYLQLVIWFAVVAGQSAVGLWAWKRRNSALAIYLGIEVARFLWLFPVARLASAHAYYIAYCIGTGVDYAAQVYLVVAIFQAIRQTGIPNKNHPAYMQGLAMVLLAAAILTLRFPLENIAQPPAVLWFYAADHVAMYWICLMLIVAPLYAYVVDAAKDTRLLLLYLGFSVYIAVRAGAVDAAIATHLIHRYKHAAEIAYFFSLVLWFASSHFQIASHQWDPAQTEFLKTALRKRSQLNELSRLERSPYP
jgi:hypothetical protein